MACHGPMIVTCWVLGVSSAEYCPGVQCVCSMFCRTQSRAMIQRLKHIDIYRYSLNMFMIYLTDFFQTEAKGWIQITR